MAEPRSAAASASGRESAPPQPAESAPPQPIEATPSRPAESPASQPAESAPNQPAESAPTQPAESAPPQPAESAPPQPADATPSPTGATPSPAGATPSPRRHRRRQRREWRDGGSTTAAWGWATVGRAVLALGAGVLAATAATRFIGGTVGGWVAQLALWVAMIVPVLLAFRASVPRGLLTWRWLDLLYGVTLGLLLRVVAGWLEQAATGAAPWPAYPTIDGSLPPDWWAADLLVPVVVAPAVEEFFFRGMLLVALYTVFRRLTRTRLVAGIGAALISTGLFILLHQLTGSLATTWDAAAFLALVGLTTATLVLLTGRIWSAVILHVVVNGTFVALALAGTLLGVDAGAPVLG